jgi:hypothetical protein
MTHAVCTTSVKAPSHQANSGCPGGFAVKFIPPQKRRRLHRRIDFRISNSDLRCPNPGIFSDGIDGTTVSYLKKTAFIWYTVDLKKKLHIAAKAALQKKKNG